MFKKVLIANRGEIAVRIARTLREMRIGSIAVYSDVDRTALHVRMSDEAYPIGPAPATESYLRIDRLIDTAKKSGADAIHPGYGFLSENPDFAEACEKPGSSSLDRPRRDACDGQQARRPRAHGERGRPIVPVVRGIDRRSHRHRARDRIPSDVEGGRGWRRKGHAPGRIRRRSRERLAEREKCLAPGIRQRHRLPRESDPAARHVEIQVLADTHGNVVHLFERDCSIQRRHQKVVEETPCPIGTPPHRTHGRRRGTRREGVGYASAGTFEFLLAEDGTFYFLEMNTRLQVEHPVTEWITGIDLVGQMVRIAAGEKLAFSQETIERRGASIECRVYAEDPEAGFLPSPGIVSSLETPSGPGVRDDGAVYPGATVSQFYDR